MAARRTTRSSSDGRNGAIDDAACKDEERSRPRIRTTDRETHDDVDANEQQPQRAAP